MKTLVIIRENNYWGAGTHAKADQAFLEARTNYKKACGRPSTGGAVVTTFEGTAAELERVTVDDIDGTIKYPKTVTKVK